MIITTIGGKPAMLPDVMNRDNSSTRPKLQISTCALGQTEDLPKRSPLERKLRGEHAREKEMG
jgi:hypothetical protein